MYSPSLKADSISLRSVRLRFSVSFQKMNDANKVMMC
jgi:hypothetical protein